MGVGYGQTEKEYGKKARVPISSKGFEVAATPKNEKNRQFGVVLPKVKN